MSLKLSRTVSYAVRATLHLARSNSESPVPCSRLAAEGNMPERFLLQILRNLVNHGILRSTRGVDGGYSLIRSPEEVSLLDIIEAIEGPMQAGALETEGIPEASQVRLHQALGDVAETARRQLESITFSQLLDAPDGRPAASATKTAKAVKAAKAAKVEHGKSGNGAAESDG